MGLDFDFNSYIESKEYIREWSTNTTNGTFQFMVVIF